MIQGSNMTRSHKGMRKGISLLELLMAIVLLGVLASIGFKYYKIYYDTTFAVKQAKVYLIIEQAAQISGAHDLFETKNAIVPNGLNDMVSDHQLKQVPPIMPEISKTGWKLNTYQTFNIYADAVNTGTTSVTTLTQQTTWDGNISLDGNDNDIAFTFKIDGNNTAPQDLLDYCNIINNTGERSWILDTNATAMETALGGNTPALAYTAAQTGTVSTSYFCYTADDTSADYNLTAVFVKLVDPA